MTESTIVRVGVLLAMLSSVVPCTAASSGVLPGLQGRLSMGYRSLSEANSLAADAQYVNTRLRLQSAELGRQRLRLQIEVADHRAFTSRHTQDSTGALLTQYDKRLRLRHLGLSVDVAGGRLQLGRFRPRLRVVGAGDTDGAAWEATHGVWRVALAGGRRVSFWKADTGPGSSQIQWGGELGWAPRTSTRLSAGAWQDEAIDGSSRQRIGVDARTRLATTDLAAHAETEAGGKWLLWRVSSGWRQAGSDWRLRLYAGGQRLPLFPVADRVDSSHYGGRSHSLGASISRRWGRDVDMGLRLRSRYGERRQRTETLHLRWARLWRNVGLRLQLTDSWSQWRQMERADLVLSSRLGRRWHVSSGASATAFEWRTSRTSEWQLRLRPHVGLRYRPAGAWEASLKVEEQVDEFENLRTQVYAGVSCRL